MKSKNTAAILAFFFGAFGGHKFYLGQTGMGLLYLLFFWTCIQEIGTFFEFFSLLFMDDLTFNMKYNTLHFIAANPSSGVTQANNVVVNVPGISDQGGSRGSEVDVVTKLEKLHQLSVSGAISAEEFADQKARLLKAS